MGKLDAIKIMDMAPFLAPDCHTEILAWRIATKLGLTTQQLHILANGLPELFGARIELDTWLSKHFAGEEIDSFQGDLKTILKAIKKIVNPGE